MTKARVYVDGLNFYYGVALAYQFKWIDYIALFSRLLAKKIENPEIEKLLLFSSEVVEPEARERQQRYFDALLKHDDRIEITYGIFQKSQKFGQIVAGSDKGKKVRVHVREEKQTDVNLACQIVDDAHLYSQQKVEFDVVCVATNDGDLAKALEIKRRLEQKTILVFPLSKQGSKSELPSKALKKVTEKSSRIYAVSEDDVRASALPGEVSGIRPPEAPGWQLT